MAVRVGFPGKESPGAEDSGGERVPGGMKYYNIDKRPGDRRSTQSNIGNLKEAIPLSCELIPGRSTRSAATHRLAKPDEKEAKLSENAVSVPNSWATQWPTTEPAGCDRGWRCEPGRVDGSGRSGDIHLLEASRLQGASPGTPAGAAVVRGKYQALLDLLNASVSVDVLTDHRLLFRFGGDD